MAKRRLERLSAAQEGLPDWFLDPLNENTDEVKDEDVKAEPVDDQAAFEQAAAA